MNGWRGMNGEDECMNNWMKRGRWTNVEMCTDGRMYRSIQIKDVRMDEETNREADGWLDGPMRQKWMDVGIQIVDRDL